MLKIAAPIVVVAGLAACAQMPGQAPAKAAATGPEVILARLDCGNGSNDPRRFSDTFAYSDSSKPFTFSCYVIKHGSDTMVWDTGYKPGSVPNAPKITLGEQLRQLGINPDQVKYVGTGLAAAARSSRRPRTRTCSATARW